MDSQVNMVNSADSVPSIKLSSSVVPLRARGIHPPLFCMHEENFEAMASVLPTERAIYGLKYRCWEEARSTLTIESLAASHLSEMLKIQPSGPYYLIGYSIGALVAYEIANLLASRSESINLLALVDVFNPALYNDHSPEAIQFREKYQADRVRKYRENLLRGRFYRLALDGSKFFEKKARAFVSSIFGNIALTPEMLLHAYSPPHFRGKLILFRVETPMEGGSEFDDDPSLGWASHVKGGVEVKFVSGRHATVVQLPHVNDLASKLGPFLNDDAKL